VLGGLKRIMSLSGRSVSFTNLQKQLPLPSNETSEALRKETERFQLEEQEWATIEQERAKERYAKQHQDRQSKKLKEARVVKVEEETWLRDYVGQVLSAQASQAPTAAGTRAATRETPSPSTTKAARQISMVELADAFNCGNNLSNV